MKKPNIKLVSYQVWKLNCEWIGEYENNSEDFNISIDYNVYKNTDDHNLFKLDVYVGIIPSELENGLVIDAKIVGYFSFEKGTSIEDKQKAIRYSGFQLLYSTLRGHVNVSTSSFPCGNFILPSVPVKEVVEAIEEKKKEGNSKIILKG